MERLQRAAKKAKRVILALMPLGVEHGPDFYATGFRFR